MIQKHTEAESFWCLELTDARIAAADGRGCGMAECAVGKAPYEPSVGDEARAG